MPSSTALADFDEFYAEWFPRTLRLAEKRGLRDPEAVANDIMLVFVEKDYRERYFTYQGTRKVTFEQWVNALVYRRLANAYRDETRRPGAVELLDHDEAVEADATVEFKVLAMQAFELLRDRYGMELADIWVSVVKQVVEDSTSSGGFARQWLIAEHLGLGATAVSTRLKELRRVITTDADLREMLGADCWAHAAA